MTRILTTLGLLPCILSLASLTLTLCHPLGTSGSDPQVSIDDATFIGRRTSDSVEFFGGIPFAVAPVDNLRLRPPVLKSFKSKYESGQQSQNTTTFNSTQFGPSCIQTSLPADQISEDCLSLNIFRPRLPRVEDDESKSEGLPVMVWFYGGGYIVGSTSHYDGTPLVNHSVYRETPTILISANYRLGPLGFPRGDDVAREAATASGILNLGLQDNIAALQWIQENVAFFGGDPSKVTVFGESAGALAVELLLLSGKLEGLARGAIMESTGFVPALSPSGSAANTAWSNFMDALPQCANTSTSLNDVECIRNLTTSELIDGFNNAQIFFNSSTAPTQWMPTLDSEIVPAFPSTLRPAHGAVGAVVIGCNKDEATLLTDQTVNSIQAISDRILLAPPSPPDASTFEREAQLKELELILNQTLALYPNNPSLGSPFDTGNATFGLDPEYKRTAAVSADMEFHSMRRFHLNQQLLPAGIRSYSFLFADPDAVPVQDFIIGNPVPGSLGVPHSSEIFYVFGTLAERPEVKQVTPTAAKLSEMMMDYWISFANVLDPNDGNGANRPDWPEYTAENQIVLQLNGHNTTGIPDDFRKEQIALFNRNPAVFGY
ncbi:hypothetical protein D9758_007331 [Tetrapyrgos nigripes]|uniref:Carboxylic ester hydrolase n=1 Tax=Tetrapyrgos nigripes TaxID=182062 RepID=A0A8H5LLH3_9AGAR|nr:hypothetical protein D9758_007331 [Tetrapyrgos nigripes]